MAKRWASLFVLYWGISHVITPPVGGALYIASSFSGVNIWRQGYEAVKLGIALFVVPFIFCYHPELLMVGEPGAIILKTIVAVAAMFCIAAAFIGHLRAPLRVWERGALAVAGAAFIEGSPWAVGFGVTVVTVALLTRGRTQVDS